MTKHHISVCICTYRRNSMLDRLLRKLATQVTADCFDFSVVVIDNDAAGPAMGLVLQRAANLGLDITYGIEEVHTIPAARNRSLRLAKGDYIAIIDDDEFPPDDWLLTMYRAIQVFDVDGALGPVYPFFDTAPPAWLLRRRFSGAPAYSTGTLLGWRQTYTGNVLLKRDVFDRHGLRFDESYDTGGSDQILFKQAMAAGCRFVAVEQAPVYEVVPTERWTKSYYIRRALVNGFNAHRASLSTNWSLSTIGAPLKASVAVLVYATALPLAVLMGDDVLVSCLEKGGHHLSRLFAMVSIQLVKKRNF
jgi:succinoglycan biosynthesis protein ExoM